MTLRCVEVVAFSFPAEVRGIRQPRDCINVVVCKPCHLLMFLCHSGYVVSYKVEDNIVF